MRRHLSVLPLIVAISALTPPTGASANLITDPGFESTLSQGLQLTWSASSYGSWGVGDGFAIAVSENGVSVPEGSRMLRFNNTLGSSTDIYQIVDISSLAADIDAGLVTASFSASFNATASNAVGLHIVGWNSAPVSFAGITFSAGNAANALVTDANTATWEQVSDAAVIQSGVRYLALGLHSNTQLPTTYADQVSLTLTTSAVPVPASAWLFASGIVGLAGVARRKTV